MKLHQFFDKEIVAIFKGNNRLLYNFTIETEENSDSTMLGDFFFRRYNYLGNFV